MATQKLKIGFAIDPLENFNPEGETTLFLMLEAQKRGHSIFAFTLPDLSYREGKVYAKVVQLYIVGIGRRPFYKILKSSYLTLDSFDVLFLRKDPPVDLAFTQHLYLLRLLEGKVFLMNEPSAILQSSEKIIPLEFQKYIPPTCISRSWDEVFRFAQGQKQGIVLKPLGGSGGQGVFAFNKIDSNVAVAFDLLSKNSTEYIVAQAYLPQVQEGDKRVLLLNGEVIGYFARVPKVGEHRANLHSGGKLKRCTLSKREQEIAEKIAPLLAKQGLYFAGLDLIGGFLTEVNITSPMGIREVNETQDIKAEQKVLDFIEREWKE